jgi:hypothetical protein
MPAVPPKGKFFRELYKLKSGEARTIRILPGKPYAPIIDFVDSYHFKPTSTTFQHPDRPTIGECFMCDHDKEHRYSQFRDKIMAEAETEL